MQDRVDVEALLQYFHVGRRATGFQTQFGHVREERIFVATEPDAQGFALEVSFLVHTGRFFASQHHSRAVEHLRHIHHGHASFAGSQRAGHPVHRDVSTIGSQHLCGRDVGATRLDRHVQPGILVKPFGSGHVVTGELGLWHPFQLNGDFFLRDGCE